MASPADLHGCIVPFFAPALQAAYYLQRDGVDAGSGWTLIYDSTEEFFTVRPNGVGIAIEWPYVRMAQDYLSEDAGETFEASTVYTDSSVPAYRTDPTDYHVINYDGVTRWYAWSVGAGRYYVVYSDNFGKRWQLWAALPNDIDGIAYNIDAYKMLQNGQIHVIASRDLGPLVGEEKYYLRSDDLGKTWRDAVLVGAVEGPAWTGGIPDTEPMGGYYWDIDLYVYGDNVAIGMIERERRLSYTSVYQDLYVSGPVLPIIYYGDRLQYYYPMDFLIKVSTDGGETFGEWTRIKNDENQTLNAGETKAWGSDNDVFFTSGLSRGPSMPDGSRLIFGSSGGDLYAMCIMWEITKTMDTSTRTEDPDDFLGTGWWHDPLESPTFRRVLVSYRIPNWTGTPERTVLKENLPEFAPTSVMDEDDDTFIVFGEIGNTIYEVFFNGTFGLNPVMAVPEMGEYYSSMGACWPFSSSGGVNVYLF